MTAPTKLLCVVGYNEVSYEHSLRPFGSLRRLFIRVPSGVWLRLSHRKRSKIARWALRSCVERGKLWGDVFSYLRHNALPTPTPRLALAMDEFFTRIDSHCGLCPA